VWLPILWLILIVIAGFFFTVIGGVIALVAAAIWVNRDSKKYGVEVGEGLWALILLFAIVGLPLYAYRLHQFREKQKSHQVTSVGSSATRAPDIRIPRFWKIWIIVAAIAILFLVGIGMATRPSAVLVKIDYTGSWSGALGYDSSGKSIDGFGAATYRVPLSGMRIVTAVIQKGSEHGTLTVSITTEDGRILAKESTTAPYGVVTVSWRG